MVQNDVKLYHDQLLVNQSAVSPYWHLTNGITTALGMIIGIIKWQCVSWVLPLRLPVISPLTHHMYEMRIHNTGFLGFTSYWTGKSFNYRPTVNLHRYRYCWKSCTMTWPESGVRWVLHFPIAVTLAPEIMLKYRCVEMTLNQVALSLIHQLPMRWCSLRFASIVFKRTLN